VLAPSQRKERRTEEEEKSECACYLWYSLFPFGNDKRGTEKEPGVAEGALLAISSKMSSTPISTGAFITVVPNTLRSNSVANNLARLLPAPVKEDV
jgi:hypothetical protein